MPDLSFFSEVPDLSAGGVLHVEALAPLSMVAAQPGSYYRSQPAPTDLMLYGLIENALGWHFGEAERRELLGKLRKQAKQQHGRGPWREADWLTTAPPETDLGFFSLLAFHLAFDGPRIIPPLMAYDDLWNQHLRRADADFFGGSRHYDPSLEALVTLERVEKAQRRPLFVSQKDADVTSLDDVDRGVKPGQKVYMGALKPRFPHYYVSPKPRGYVEPQGTYRFGAHATPRVAAMIRDALADPDAPLYLGSNDGWVEARWEALP